MKTRTNEEEDDSDVSGLGVLILAIFAIVSLLIGALMTWGTFLLIEKFLFKIENPLFTTAILVVYAGLTFCMTPTFGNARRVKRTSAKMLGLPTAPLDKDH